ncbi:DUF7507 domain-containing protein [Flavobacterium magnesitis]|uniref:DUF7507 domain-containing protein n=1 Tax=Flavobacterium magnesitis TaxID=3138077 RepID=UPI00358E529F
MNAQSGGCDITGSSSGNYTFQSNKKVCFYSNATLGDVTFQNGTTIYIAPNVTVNIQNNVTSSGTIYIEIEGTLQFNQSVTINANVDITIGTKGILRAGETGTTNFTLNGNGVNNITNNGQFNVGVLGLQNSSGTFTFDSSANAIINIKSNINIGGKSFFRNQGKLLIGNSYNCNNKSVFVNCGEMISSAGFNLGGGKVINTGKFTVSSSRIDFGSSTARFENYGSVNVQGSMNLGGTGCVYYNEGTTVVSDNFQNDGNIEGPAVGSGKLGYITWSGRAAMNSGKIGPNLNLINSGGTSSKSGMFNNPNGINVLQGVVYNCTNCLAPQVNSGAICREPDGTTPCNIATPTISTTAASCTQPSSLLISNYDSSVSYTITPSGPTVLSGGGITGMTVGQSYTLKATKNSCISNNVPISINKLTGTDTDGDGILDQCEFDETCNVYTTVLAEPTDKLVNDLNKYGEGLFPVQPFGPKTLPNGGVNVKVIKGFKSTLTYPDPQWRLYQPNAITGTIVIKGVPTEFKTKYLDLIYASANNLERTVKLDYGVTANSLNTTTHKYRYIVGIAGLSDPNVAGTVTSTVPLEVIGNFDAFKNGKYSYFNDKTPPVAGETGYVFQSNPKTATNVAPPNGYTFFYLPENISSFELETKGNDQYGFIFGTLTTTVTPPPAAPTSGGDQTVCWNGNANHTLTATATAPQGQIVTWYETATGGTPITPTLEGVGTKTYYAQSSNPNGTCASETRTAVTLTINSCSISLTKDGTYVDTNNDGITNVGDQISYTFVVKNTGNVSLTNIQVTDNNATVMGGPITTLAPGASDNNSFTAIHTITQEDIDAGQVDNLATAKGTAPTGQDVTATSTDPTPCQNCTPINPVCTTCTITELTQTPSIALVKTASVGGTGIVGDVITYTFAVTNTGNTTLTNVVVTDPMVGLAITGNPIATLAVGASSSVITGTYTITQADVDAGKVVNTALATAQDPKGNDVTDISGTTVDNNTPTETPVTQTPSIALVKTASVGGTGIVGDVITYTFAVTNTGNTTLTNVVVTDPMVGLAITGNPIATLAVGASSSVITGTYTITQADVDAGKVVNTALATAQDPKGNDVTDISGTTVDNNTPTETPVTQTPSIALVKTADKTNYDTLGEVITYTIVVTNTGNVNLHQVVVSDPLTGLNSVIENLTIGESREFTENYIVTQTDLGNETITNTATADGLSPTNVPVNSSDTVVIDRAFVLGCGTIVVHNAFTPNGDNINDNFVIDNIDDTLCYPENTVEIYNRWGILVYETKGYDNVNNSFKGYSEGRVTVDKSAGLPTGTYFYILNYTAVGLQGEMIPKKEQGYLYLTR